jgi:hypothetical protein
VAATAQEAALARLDEPESTRGRGPGHAVVVEEIVVPRQGTTHAALCPTGAAMWETGYFLLILPVAAFIYELLFLGPTH